ncbi:MAG TPA: hypothetical protein VF053_20670 [Streptosporangiales bacterium]
MSTAADPFDTAGIRTRVLDTWTATPARFREDANAEEDYALGAYRDRLVVELAQNAADAAAAAGRPGRLRLTLTATELRAANVGAPVDAAGVASLSSLRASAKRDGMSAGRFGVGYAAVLSVSDEPRILSREGGVRWSRDRTRATVRDLPALADELARRDEHVPVLRLPFPCDEKPAAGFDTEVVLPLRDEAARRFAHRMLADAGPALLLGLPGLHTVQIAVAGVVRELRGRREGDDVAVVDDGGSVTRWRLASAVGDLAPELLVDRPAEERARTGWSVTWALPVDAADRPRALPAGVAAVLHAPTPSDEPVDLPALLLGSFPLDPARRHVAPGPLTDFLVERAAEAYADLLVALPPRPDALDLVPGPVAAGVLDGALRRSVLSAIRGRAFLPSAETGSPRLPPRDAVAVDGSPGLIDVLAPVLPGLLPAGWATRTSALRWLEVRQWGLADVVDLLGSLDRPPQWWRRVYAELAGSDLDALGAVPVPLADGRTVRGPRGVLLPTSGVDAGALAALGVRVADPDAVHPLLLRLGAVEASPRAVLDDPHVRAAVAASYEADDPDVVAAAVLPAVAAGTPDPSGDPWLGSLALRDRDDDVRPADELLLPDGPLARVVSDDAPFGVVSGELVDRWGSEVLERVGVLATFAVVHDEDVSLDAESCDHDLDDEDGWVDAANAAVGDPELPPVAVEFDAVRDLDLVADDRWPEALRLLAEPPLRSAVVEPATVLLPDGRRRLVPSYTAWWLRTHPVLGGRLPTELRLSGADAALAGLYDEVAADDAAFYTALGVRTTLDRLLAEPDGPAELLDRMGDPDRHVDAANLARLYSALAEVADRDAVEPPARLRVARGLNTEVVDADDVVVLDAPDLLPLLGERPCLAVRHDRAREVAGLLGVRLASEAVVGEVESDGDLEPVPDLVFAVLDSAVTRYVAHDPLIVDGLSVPWRCVGGRLHAASLAGVARGVAWLSGRWELRHLLAALLEEPASAPSLLAEARLDVGPER